MHTPTMISKAFISFALIITCAISFTPRLYALELQPGDHICIIGNTLAERMQHDGTLETLIHARFPNHKLVFRNLGYSGDEIGGYIGRESNPNLRMRSKDFGTADQWLSAKAPIPQPTKLRPNATANPNRFENVETKADVIFAFFGYNESFAGEAGLPKFKETLTKFIRHTLGQKYNGKSAPRLVIFSPTAHENTSNNNLPDGGENNKRLKAYSAAMEEICAAERVEFVDLFSITHQEFNPSRRLTPVLTINGVHLNNLGNQRVALRIDRQLFEKDKRSITQDMNSLEPLRKVVNEKNALFFQRYRATDGFSVHGTRAFNKFVDDQSNYEVGQRELEVIDQMVKNRDAAVWAAAQGKPITVKDDNLPPFLPVKTNKPGKGPNGAHEFLGGEEAIKKMKVHSQLQVNLFASEEQFPELAKPVQMAFDTRGRLWVATWGTYPHWKPTTPMNDKLLIFEDTNGDGRADVCKTFADDLHNPTGFEFWNGGVYVAGGPDVLFLKDTNGDDKYDVKERVLHGFDTADTHHTINSFTIDAGGALYFQEGLFHHTQVETPWGPPIRNANAAVYRYELRTNKLDVYVPYPFANPHGHVFDYWGQDFVTDGTNANNYHAAIFSGHLNYPHKHPEAPMIYNQRTRPCPGTEIITGGHFPESMRGNMLVGNVIGFQGILQYKIDDDRSSFKGTEVEPILSSTDPNFRPSDMEIAPDGSLYFTDWQNPIIGHLQHNLRDPSRDQTHGRIYRVTVKGQKLVAPRQVEGQSIARLLELLKSNDNRLRFRARIELSKHKGEEVVAALDQWRMDLDKQDANYEHHLLEALWAYQAQNRIQIQVLENVLHAKDFRARAAAVKILCAWRDQIPNALELLNQLAADPAARVRLEAVRAASFFKVPEAYEVVLIAGEQPMDEFIDYVSDETKRALDSYLNRARKENTRIPFRTDIGRAYHLKTLSVEKLLAEQKSELVLRTILMRPGIDQANRAAALDQLAKLTKRSSLDLIVNLIEALDKEFGSFETSVVTDLVQLLNSRKDIPLTASRDVLEKLATTSKQPLLRQIAYVTLMKNDGNGERVWKLATANPRRLLDLLDALPLVADGGTRASLFEKILRLLTTLPPQLKAQAEQKQNGQIVRIELQGKATLSLAEVEVISGGKNVARKGIANQRNTAYGLDASRAIDGNTSGRYADRSITHTEENKSNPYWEVDLGKEVPIDLIVIYNRTDENLGKRLENFTLRVLDKDRHEIYSQSNIKAPDQFGEFTVPMNQIESNIRHSAMLAVANIRGQEAKVFQALLPFFENEADRPFAIRAALKMPQSTWPAELAPTILPPLVNAIRAMPVKMRTTPEGLDALNFADSLTSLLSAEQAKSMRKELEGLGVRVIKISTVFEKMAYDKELIVVKAGKPVEFVLDNNDLMPHNFVVLKPGTLEAIGTYSEEHSQEPAFAEQNFVPKSSNVLAASKLLQHHAIERVSLNVPKQPGVYPFVCTYPGHWRRMFGALYVVEDLDEYQANPEAYLAKNKIEPVDELLKFNRPRTEWKLAELQDEADQLLDKKGRDFANGKTVFKVGTCVACHKLNGEGNEFGPDLARLDPTWKPRDVLAHIIDPALRINEKYQSWSFEMKNGTTKTGVVLKETEPAYEIIENPLASTQSTMINRSDIDERTKIPSSLMPKGLLDKLSRAEVFDLLAYVYSGGNAKHAVFSGAGHEHHGHGKQDHGAHSKTSPVPNATPAQSSKSGGGHSHDAHRH